MSSVPGQAGEAPKTIFKLPRGTCDTHCHVFGPFDRFPIRGTPKYTPKETSKETLAAMHARIGVDRVVIVQASPQGADNRCLVDALQQLNAGGEIQARGVAVIDESTPPDDLRTLHSAGVRGVRVNLESAGQHDPEVARRAMREAVTLEYDLDGAGRGHRDSTISALLQELTGAEAACVVNNNAAAVLLMLNALGDGREVVVSRGELVEIGGAFRVPDIMATSGATLRISNLSKRFSSARGKVSVTTTRVTGAVVNFSTA